MNSEWPSEKMKRRMKATGINENVCYFWRRVAGQVAGGIEQVGRRQGKCLHRILTARDDPE